MASDEHGMPVPSDPTQDASAFFAYRDHAAKWHVKCREIVRRLAEWDKKYPKGTIHGFNAEKEHDAIATDAAKLWSKMQEEAKGGDGGETVPTSER